MSILSKNNCENSTPFFHEFKKQASFFLKEKIKSARLALTDVTPAELLTEEATVGNPWAPDARTLSSISRSAFEIDDYTRIVEILHKRFLKFETKNWRLSYNSLIVLEHLLTHGPESVRDEFQGEKDVIKEIESFQYIDEKGFNWGLTARKKSERVLKLLEMGPLFKEERDRARKLSRGIQGFGSFTQRSSSSQKILRETSVETYGRCNSQFSSHENQENQENMIPYFKDEAFKIKNERPSLKEKAESLSFVKAETSVKENLAPHEEDDFHGWNRVGEAKPLLDSEFNESKVVISTDDDHPFSDANKRSSASLL
ncbi:ENTH domain containing protein [Parasponia andersonii]|uniref:ENTH domain containing protein n=1 Tax=Parasponia andersonii TaxID=3476 RepID=A0A2P5AJI9_PARAD|nr:ENTH domain containing protein [Parasponia andersonii]